MSKLPEPFWREVGPGRVEVVYPGFRGSSSRVVVVGSVGAARTLLEGAPAEIVDVSLYAGSFERFFVGQVRHLGVQIENRSQVPANYKVHGPFIKDDHTGVVGARSIENIDFKLSPRCKKAWLEIEGVVVAEYEPPVQESAAKLV